MMGSEFGYGFGYGFHGLGMVVFWLLFVILMVLLVREFPVETETGTTKVPGKFLMNVSRAVRSKRRSTKRKRTLT